MPFISTINGVVSVTSGGGAAEYLSQLQEAAGGGGGGGGYDPATDGFFQLRLTVDNPNNYDTPANDQFGVRSAICESYFLVGAPGEDEAGASASGAAYIFSTTDGSLLHTLINPNNSGTKANDSFGQYGVEISEDYAIVSTLREDSFGQTDTGAVYVFDPSTGTRLRTFANPEPAANTYFAREVKLSGNLLAVGADGVADGVNNNSGKVYVYDITQVSNGGLKYSITNPNTFGTSATDVFGQGIAISQTYLAISAPGEDQGGDYAGIVYLYDTATGAFLREIDNPDLADGASDRFGQYMAIDDHWLAVTAPGANNSQGKVYVYDLNDNTNTITAILEYDPALEGAGPHFSWGSALAISGNTIIAGSNSMRDTVTPTRYGSVCVYDLSNNGAMVQRLVHPVNPDADRGFAIGFGYIGAVGLFNDKLIISDQFATVGGYTWAGQAYVYGPGGTDNGLTP